MSNELPPLTRLIMAAEAIDAQAATSSRSGQMEDLEVEATVLRQVHGDLTAEMASLRARALRTARISLETSGLTVERAADGRIHLYVSGIHVDAEIDMDEAVAMDLLVMLANPEDAS